MTYPLLSVAIGELVDRVDTWNPMNSASDDPFPYIDISTLDREAKEILPPSLVNPKDAPSRARQHIKTGDILVSTVRPNLNAVAQVSDQFDGAIASTGFCVLRPKQQKLLSGYLFYWVRSPQFTNEMVRRATGASYPAVSDNIVKESKIPYVSLEEQRRVVTILDKADTIRHKRREAIRLIEDLNRSIFLDMFGDPVANKNGFPIVKMGDVCDVRDGTHDSPRYVAEGGYPLVTSKNLTGGTLDLTDVNLISETDYIQINKRSKVDRGDIIMPMIGTIGSPVLIEHEPYYAIKNVALIKFGKGSPSAVFVRHLLSSHYFDYIVGQKSRGGTQQFISLGDLRSFPLVMPSPELQREFSRRCSVIDKCKNIHRAAVSEAGNLFNGLAQRAFSGELT